MRVVGKLSGHPPAARRRCLPPPPACYTSRMSDVVVPADEMNTIAVLGAGTMGRGIAQVAAQAGLTVVLRDLDAAVVEDARQRIRGNLDKGVELGKVSAEQRDAAMARISGATELAQAVAGADVVVEAVPEILDLKASIFAEVAAAAPPRALLATNTSSLPVASIAARIAEPGRLVGMHFFNPVHLMKLVEVVHHPGTAPAALAAARDLAVRMGKTAIVVRDSPGFASSRLGIALGVEAIRMVEEEVASPADIDTAMKLGYGHPMGPLELTDLVGLDVRLAIAEYLTQAIGPSFEPPALLRRLVADGKLGKKSGEGFYRWEGGKRVG
jgi:3-hydroxybutyryl-CoA dehydrogenase